MTHRNQQRFARKPRVRLAETLEGRSLLAGDLVAHWRADDLNVALADQAAVTTWANAIATGPAALSTGQPILAKGAIGGRSAVRFNATDGIDGLTVASSLDPLSAANDFSMAIAFATSSTSLVGGDVEWFNNSGLVDANNLGFGFDVGLSITSAGKLATGMGNGFGQPSQTIRSASGLNDGQLHTGIVTRQQGTMTLYVDGQVAASTTTASSNPRSALLLAIGKTASGSNGFSGDIAEVRIYNGQLSASEVTTLNSGLRSYYGNSVPHANADAYTLAEDASVLESLVSTARGVLANDTDPDGDSITAVLVTPPQHGTVTLNADGSFLYDSEANFFGSDSFTYAAKDSRPSEPATVSITVTPKYDAAVAVADTYKVISLVPLVVGSSEGLLTNDTNIDKTPLKVELVAAPAAGQLTLNSDGSFRYDPQSFTGRTSFRYRINDGTGFSNPVDVTLIINFAPTGNDDTYAIAEDGTLVVASSNGVLNNDNDRDNNPLTAVLVDSVEHGTLTLNSNGGFTYTPTANYFGADRFTYTVSDGEELSRLTTVHLNVTPVNDSPIAIDDTYYGVVGRPVIVAAPRSILANDTDIDATAPPHAELEAAPSSGELTLQSDGTFTYTPASDFIGVASFTYRTNDGKLRSAPATVRIVMNSLEQQRQVVINEIHINPDIETEQVEFIELYNGGTTPVVLSEWTLRNGVQFKLPEGTLLDPGQYLVIAQDPAEFAKKFSRNALGPWTGVLSNESDTVELWTQSGDLVDAIDYQLGFPWPTYGDAPGPSIQLVNPQLDNGLGGNWRSAVPTPGVANSVLANNSAPSMRQIEHSPQQPTGDQPVTITARVTDPEGVKRVTLQYQIVEPGAYIASSDATFATQWTSLAMHDDGIAGDEAANDGIFTVVVPASVQVHRRLIRYRVQATDTQDASRTAPYEDDPQRNFAYFVYNGVPDWTASVNPGATPAATFGSQVLNSLPVYQLITKRESHIDAQFIPNATRGSGYAGSDYLWEGTLIYDGVVYDQIHFRARGGVWRYAMGKNMWKFDFNRGHSFQARDDRGNQYPTTWDKLNFSSIIQQGDYQHRGEQGLFESVGFRLLNLAGSEAPRTNYVHFRIIENTSETGADQYSGDFQGMYLNVEQPDGRFLDAHGLPDGNFYKIENNTPESIANQGPYQVDTATDAKEFLRNFTGAKKPDVTWWRDNLNVEDFYSYQAIAEAIHHYDTAFGKNFFYYHNPDTNKWEMKAWDLDLTWADNMFGSAGHEFNVKVAKNPAFNSYTNPANIALNNKLNHEYQNRVRELRDLLYNPEQTGMLIDEQASFVYQPGQLSFVDADRAMWDYNPTIAKASRYTNNDKNGTRFHYYGVVPTKDYAGMIKKMKDYVVSRGSFMDRTLLTNEANVPSQPSITYTGPGDYPVDGLTFRSGNFQSPIGASFAAMEWRLAEVTDPNAPGYNPYDKSTPRNYEVTSTWQSGPLTTFNDTMQIPGERLKPGATYRVRVRMKDNDDHWSHWSAPIQFVASTADGTDLRNGLRVSEVMYHPQDPNDAERAAGISDGEDFEFIELVNISDKTLSLVGLTLDTVSTANGDQGVSFSFADGDIRELGPGQRVVVVENEAAFQARYGQTLPVAGEWSGRLDNSAEQITLSAFGSLVQQFTYSDAWYVSTDGRGASLVVVDAKQTDLDYWNRSIGWNASSQQNGTPGRAEGGIVGDANHDGRFDLADLVAIFQAGEYEDATSGNSTWEEGDWNGDGDFNTSDLILAFQAGTYAAAARPTAFAARNVDLFFDNLTSDDDEEGDGENEDE